MTLVVPAVLPSSRADLDEKLARFARVPAVSRVQIDVVDGRFAAPASWPYSAPGALERMAERREMLPCLNKVAYEIDLMCLDAERAASLWLSLGATRLTFHAETATNLSRLLSLVRNLFSAGVTSGLVSFGLALNLESDLALIEACIGDVEYVQFMGIARIGRQGQPFDERVFEKVRAFRARHPGFPVQVDGGLSLQSAKKLIGLRVTNLVIGSALLSGGDVAAALAAFEGLVSPYGV